MKLIRKKKNMLIKYYHYTIKMFEFDDSSYKLFEQMNCKNIQDKEVFDYKVTSKGFNNSMFHYDKTCDIRNVALENEMFKKSYLVNDSCCDDECYNKFKYDKYKNDCLGWDCVSGSFLHEPDNHNTFHNYLVFKDRENIGETFCTENHQVLNNWTRRQYIFKPEERENNIIFEFQDIPDLVLQKHDFKKEPHQCLKCN
jgi:hypothetical protein